MASFLRTALANTDTLLGPFGVPIRELPTVGQFCRVSLGLLQRGDYCEWIELSLVKINLNIHLFLRKNRWCELL